MYHQKNQSIILFAKNKIAQIEGIHIIVKNFIKFLFDKMHIR